MTKIPLAVGSVLWLGATALLLEDAWHQGHVTASHLMMPVLTSGTVAAAVMSHHRLASLKILSGLGFVLLALLGSVATVYGTMGRTAETRDLKAAAAETTNRALAAKQQALADARRLAREAEAEVARECRTGFGKNCGGWRQALADRQSDARRVEAEQSSMQSVPADPRADAVARLAMLLGASDEARLRAIVAALDPVVLPLFLELGSILFFAAGVPHARAKEIVGEDEDGVSEDGESDSQYAPTTRDDAWRDLRGLLAGGTVTDGRLLARRWRVSETTVSRWLSSWQREGLIGRARDGKSRRPTSA